MKILMAVHDFPPEFRGGVERSVELLALELLQRGHEVCVFAGSQARPDAPRLETQEHRGIAIKRWRRKGGIVDAVDVHDPHAEDAFEACLDDFRPDVVHVHHWFQLSTGLVAAAARRGRPAVVTLHDFWSTCGLFFRLPDGGQEFCREVEREESCLPCLARHHPTDATEQQQSFRMRRRSLEQELGLARAILVSSAAQVRALASLGGFSTDIVGRMRIRPLGVAPVIAKAAPAKKDPDLCVIAHWGNLSPLKGTELLVRAASRAKAHRRLRLRLLGESPDEGWLIRLRDLAAGLRLELAGAYEADQLPDLLADVDLAVFPSLAMETHSLVLDEAMALGLPVIVSDRGALPERIGGRGIVTPAGDLAALTAAIDRLADPEARRAIREGSPPRMVSMFEYTSSVIATYDDALAAGAPPIAEATDLARERLAFRNARLEEIARYVNLMEARLRVQGGERTP
ncbi:MAG: glycosyltransferase [Planctomycetes bacterium]|nr:glycosyltransferase [Planctomycetota bacterium]